MGLADLHIHTTYSYDGTSTVSAVFKKAAEIGMDVIAITDHDEIRGALEAQELAAHHGLAVIPGSEVSTAEGHLLALFIQCRVPRGLTLEASLRRVAEQGGLAIAPHPGGMRFNSLSPEAIRRALKDPELARVLVGVEVYNAGMFLPGRNAVAQQLADDLPVAQIGNSDAHLLWMLGKGATLFSGKTAAELRTALETRSTWPVQGKEESRVFLVAHWISRYALRKAGWVSSTTGPQEKLRLVRQSRQETHEALISA
jgi:predicted metal-dependent phosphoesterase TrpH